MVLAGCGAHEAEQKRLELQQAVDAVYLEARPGIRLPLGLSLGTAVFPHDGASYETLLATADRRMYEDKGFRKRRSGLMGGRESPDGGQSGIPDLSELLEPEVLKTASGRD